RTCNICRLYTRLSRSTGAARRPPLQVCYGLRRVRGLLVFGACILPLLVMHGAGAAAAPHEDDSALAAVELHEGKNALAGHAFVLEDETGELRFEDVRDSRNHPFRPLARGEQNAGHSRSTYWLRFRVRNATSSSSFIVELSMTPEVAELYGGAAP